MKIAILLVLSTFATLDAFTIAKAPAVKQPLLLRGGGVAMDAASLVATPQAGYDGAVAAGIKKANMPASKVFQLGMLSGAHIGFGALLMLSVGGACPGIAAANPGLQKIILGAFGLVRGQLATTRSPLPTLARGPHTPSHAARMPPTPVAARHHESQTAARWPAPLRSPARSRSAASCRLAPSRWSWARSRLAFS